MPEPTVSKTTRRLYDRLPEMYRTVDRDARGDFPLLRYLSVATGQAGAAEALLDRMDCLTPDEVREAGAEAPPGPQTSHLVDPAEADAEWLPWLAQLVGARLRGGLTEADRRASIANAVGGWQAGTRAGIVAAAQQALTGPRYVTLANHHGGDPFAIGVTTLAPETASPAAVLAAVQEANAKPAGIVLTHTYYAASWATIEAEYPTWADREAAGSWGNIEATQP